MQAGRREIWRGGGIARGRGVEGGGVVEGREKDKGGRREGET